MVKLFVSILLALAIGAALSIYLADDPGYILIQFQSYSIEATVVSFIFFIVGMFVFVYALWWLVKIFNPFKLLKKDTWRSIFFKENAKIATERGLKLLLLGHWQQAYKVLVENAEISPSPTFNYLSASFAAYQRKDRLSWSYCLDQAEKKSTVATEGIKNLKALFEFRSGQVEQSLAILLALKKQEPDSPYVLSLIKEIYVSSSDWEKLEALLPDLEKNKVLTEKEKIELLNQIAIYRLNACASQDALKETWSGLSKQMKANEDLASLYLEKLIGFGQDAEAMIALNRYLKQNWSDKLVEMSARFDTADVGQLLLRLEGWIKSRPNNVILMLSLGRVSLRNQLWGKAREYFETALRFSDNDKLSAEINAELARLLANLGEQEKSIACYSQAISLIDRELPDLPMPVKTR